MLEVIKLFVRRMLMGKGKGILQIPPQKAVDDFANDLYKKFKQNGVSDEAITNPKDVKIVWEQITNREAQIFTNNLKDALQKPDPFKKAGEVFDLKGKKIKNPQNIMGGEELPGEINIFSNKYLNDLDKKIIDSDAFGYSQKEWNNLSNSSKEKFRKQFDSNYADAMENTQMATLKEVETEAQILAKLNKGNKESLSNMRYEKAVKAEEAKAAADEDYIMKIFDPEDFAEGGRAGLYRGGQAEIEPSLSDIGHGSDALMARNALLTPGSQATTSTGLNYLLGEDNDTTRVPYGEAGPVTQQELDNYLKDRKKRDKEMGKEEFLEDFKKWKKYQNKDIDYAAEGGIMGYKHGNMVLPKEKPMDEYILKKLMSQAGAETLDTRTRDMFIQMYKKKIKEKNSKADGGRTEYAFGGTGGKTSSTSFGNNQGEGANNSGYKNIFQTGAITQTPGRTVSTGGPPGGGDPTMTYTKSPVTTGGQSPFGYTKPEPKSYNYGINNITKAQKFKNWLGKKSGYTQHNINNQKLRNALDDEEITEEQYKLMGGWDVAKNMPKTVTPNVFNVGIASGLYNAIKPGTEYNDIGALESIGLNTQGATGLGKKNQMMYDDIVEGKKFFNNENEMYNNFADGGPARQNFGIGGMSRRAFLKLFGSGVATVGAAKSGLFSLLKGGASKKAATEIATSAGSGTPPPYFFKLVNKIKKLGDDATPKYGSQPREKVTSYKDYTLSEELDSGRTTIKRFKQSEVDYYDEMLMEETYMSHTPGKGLADETTKGKNIPDEYTEDTSFMRTSSPQKGDIVDTVDGVSDDILEEVGEAVVKKADGGRIGYGLGKKVVETVIKKAGEGKFTKNEVLLNMFQNTIKQSKSPDTKKRFINFIEEIKLKPELSKDPNVWNFFTKGLPKNQKLVVYGDDTVDFWTQSEFGPHNIATSAKFQKKHPYLTKDQAVKIQNMEPEDQIFEMKRLEVLRKRTANATGGRVPMVFGGGIYKAIIKNLAKARGVNPSEYLKVTNYKTLPSEVRNLMSKADFEKMKAGRIEMFENWVDMAKTRKEFLRNIEEGKKSPAAPIFEHLEQSFKSPVPSSVTDKDILQGEFILKNLKTKNRKLHSSGGIAAMLGE